MAENIQSIKHQRVQLSLQLGKRLRRMGQIMRTWHDRRQERRLLAQLPPHLLKDIGVTEASRYEEVNKPFWKE